MLQVGCTINYARSALWKETEEFLRQRRQLLVWERNCLGGDRQPIVHVGTAALGCPASEARLLLSARDSQLDSSLALTISARSARMIEAVRNGQLVVSSTSGPVAQLGARFHGMEEVVGSIPTRSTKSHNRLDGATARVHGVCVMVCVITRRFSAHSKGFHRCPLCFHPHVAVPLQHATAHVSGNRHDR
jgi:hypothetical protein